KGYPESYELIKEKGYLIFLISPSIYNGALNSQISEIIMSEKTRMLINDIKDTELSYMKHLKKMNISTVNFDDLGEGRILADLLFDSFYAEEKSGLREYFGPRYVVLRDEFIRRKERRGNISQPVRSLAVLMGSTNAGNYLEKIFKALVRLPDNIECHIILGKNVANSELYQLDYPRKNFLFHYQPENIAELFSQVDLAVTAGGISMCETCILGIPTLVIPQVPHESQNAKVFEKFGAVFALDYNPDISEHEIHTPLIRLIQDHEKRKKLSQHARQIVDGKGLERIVDIILSRLM
ncbi:MAG: hypothetical protein JW774_12245, partial [Candidatus Aureabacteria bacterium]|nr:hypothetical protein [Candidatus Auribacterota bacterium]